MSIHFYSNTYQEYINYGHNRADIINLIQNKGYPGGGTLTGAAVNQTVARIMAANYPNGVPKILVIMTDGVSYDDVLYAA